MIDVLLCDAMLVRHFRLLCLFFFFFFNDTATTEIYTLSLHDALPISRVSSPRPGCSTLTTSAPRSASAMAHMGDRKSTRLNSSHLVISYAVFCLKKKKQELTAYMRNTPLAHLYLCTVLLRRPLQPARV